MARFVNLVYALLIEGRDEDGRSELDRELDAPTEWEAAKAQRFMDSGVAEPMPEIAPAWFGDDDIDPSWTAANRG